MSEKIVQLNEEVIKGQIKELVRGSVEETLNGLLEAEAEKLTQAAKYERSEERQGYRSGHYSRNLTTTSGDVTLNVPRLKGISFETAIIERYRRRESSVEEALIEMYLFCCTSDNFQLGRISFLCQSELLHCSLLCDDASYAGTGVSLCYNLHARPSTGAGGRWLHRPVRAKNVPPTRRKRPVSLG